jgi:hypothetical protein
MSDGVSVAVFAGAHPLRGKGATGTSAVTSISGEVGPVQRRKCDYTRPIERNSDPAERNSAFTK